MHKTCQLILLLLVLNLPTQAQAAPLDGDYYIGGSSFDYATINLAVADLVSSGISGPVNFLISGGSYDEQVTIGAFQRYGLSTDRVTFTRSGPAQGVHWFYSSVNTSNPWILKLDGSDYITFSDLNFHAVIPGFGNMVYFEGASNNITFESNLFDGELGVGKLIFQNAPGNHVLTRFISNTFSQGEIAIDFDYIFGGADSRGVEIYGNTFTNQFSKSVEAGTHGLVIYNNTVSTVSTSDSDYIGFDIKDTDVQVENNTFDLLKGQAAIKVAEGGGGSIDPEVRIINNMIALRDSNATLAGIHVIRKNVSIYHNTVRSLSSTAPALVVGGEELRVQNNILVNAGGGIALKIYNTSDILISDYNDIYSTGNPLVSANNSNYNSLASYINATGLDTNSIEQSVSFVDTTGVNDLHLAAPNNNDVDFLAPLITGVTTDFDGDSRGAVSVYKGADEGIAFVPLDNADTSNGFYTVAGSNPDYSTPSAAIIDLKQRGMKGPVTFRIRAGFYTTHQTIAGVNRSGSSDDLLLFMADDINNPPTLRYNTSTEIKNWVIKVQDMSDISFDHINFYSSGSGIYGNLLVIEGDSDNISVRDGTFTGVSDLSVDTAALILATEQSADNYEFINNQFINGSIALNLIPSAVFTSPRGNRLIVESNTFSQQGLHALLTNHDDIDFIGNEVTNTVNDFTAVHVRLNRDTQVSKNKFLLTGLNSTAMYFDHANGATNANPNVIANNFIKATTGIALYNGSSGFEMYYNSIVATLLPINIQGYIYHSDGITLLNNILINNGSGAVIYVDPDATIDDSNFNNFINSSGALLDWQGSQYTSLSAFQNATGFDTRSTTTPVFFNDLNNADFHLVSSSIGNTALTGTPVSLVTDDYDSEARPSVSPYMGADQVAGQPIMNTYSIGGTISGLASGNTVSLLNSNGDELLNQTNGGFTFSIHPNDGDAYNVNVSTQPTSPDQTCSVANGSGNLSGDDITNINIVCQTNFYSIGGTVTGLNAGSSVTLQYNSAENLTVANNGSFTFLNLLENGHSYDVIVYIPPTNPRQTCAITNGSSTVSGSNVTDVAVNCVTNTYSVGGTVSGLLPGNTVELQNNHGNNLTVSGNGSFTFTEEFDSNGSYAVTVLNQPNNPLQTCLITNGSGDVNTLDINNIQVSCSTDTFTIGGTVTGLVSGSSFTLQGNLGGSGVIKFILDNGIYAFPDELQNGVTYDVTVIAPPGTGTAYPYQLCTVSNATGAISGEDVTNIDINCVTETFSVGGHVSGLASGNSVELQNNAGDNLTVSGNGLFEFSEELDSTKTYAVSVLNQPNTPEQECIITNGSGDINTADITNVEIDCSADEFTVGGTLAGLIGGNSVVLRNNNGNDLEVSANGNFTFTTSLGDGESYGVTVFTEPTDPIQFCTVINGSGTLDGANVTNVYVSCDSFDLIFANGFEAGAKATKQNQSHNKKDDTNEVKLNEGQLNEDQLNEDQLNEDQLNEERTSGSPTPQMVPGFNFMGLMLMIIGFLMAVKISGCRNLIKS